MQICRPFQIQVVVAAESVSQLIDVMLEVVRVEGRLNLDLNFGRVWYHNISVICSLAAYLYDLPISNVNNRPDHLLVLRIINPGFVCHPCGRGLWASLGVELLPWHL